MPPFNKRRLPGDIRRWRRSLRTTVTPPLFARDEFEDESDENNSPISKKSEIPFTFESKRGHGDDADEEAGDGNGHGHGHGASGDMVKSSVKGQLVSNGLEPGLNPEPDSESDMEDVEDVEDVESDVESDPGSDYENDGSLPPPSPPPPPPPRSTTTATIATTFTPLPPASTTTTPPALTLIPNTPPPVETSPTPTRQRPSDMFVPIAEPTIGFPTTDAILSTLTASSIAEVTTQPRKGLDDPITTTDTVWVTALPFMQSSVAPSSTDLDFPPIYTVLPDSDPTREQDEDFSRDKKDKDKFPPPGLDPTAEHLLIAAGAIGAFILICFIGWIVYRTLKKSDSRWGGNNIADKLPWRRKGAMGGSWANGGMYPPTEPPPMYDKGNTNSMAEAGFYAAGKVYSPGPGSVARSATGTYQRRQQESESESPLASILDQYPQGNEGTVDRNIEGQPTGSQLQGSTYYTQTDPTRQASDSYDPSSRQAYRASALSSISSGFGDGEMIMPQPTTTIPPPPPIPTSDNAAGRFSWMSRRDDRRETVYTQTSEDRPARFRSVASWVNQQTGRIKRADSRARERGEVPVMPAIPGQISVTQQTTYR